MNGRRDAVAVAILVAAIGLAGCSSHAASPRGRTTTTTAAAGTTASSGTAPSSSTTATTAPPGPAGGPVPAGFRAQSVTFVSAATGWVLGSAPCGTPPCTAVVRTRDGGRSWVGLPAPTAAVTSHLSGSGVSTIRFADPLDGWAFGPDLWATHDGGAHWHRLTLPAVPAPSAVVSLEAGAGQVWALVVPQHCCGDAVVERAAAGSDGWVPEPGAAVPGGQQGRVLVSGSAAWAVVTTSQGAGVFLARTAAGWQHRSLPCPAPTDALAAASASEVSVVCGGQGAAGSQVKELYVSHDGGASFAAAGQAPMSGDLEEVAMASPSTVVVAAASGASFLHATFNGGASWSTVYTDTNSGGLPFRDLGFTTASQGVVVEGLAVQEIAQQPPSRLLVTRDGGHSWAPVSFGA